MSMRIDISGIEKAIGVKSNFHISHISLSVDDVDWQDIEFLYILVFAFSLKTILGLTGISSKLKNQNNSPMNVNLGNESTV